MTIDEMKNRKREFGYTNRAIAEMTGLPLSTVQKVFSGATSAPRAATIRALEKLLSVRPEPSPTGLPPVRSMDLPAGTGVVRETAPAWGSAQKESGPGTYTLEDYLALPDDQRVELIDGVFYDMAAPTTIHQSIGGFIYKKLLDHVLANRGPCYPFISPVDVQLDMDDKTVVQPDVLVVCDRSKYKNGRIFGAPDLVIEVLSPSTRKKDMQLKHYKYSNAGVREYWMIDTGQKLVVQYDLENLGFPAVYGFDSTIPVLIWDGACRIDLREMSEAVSFLWELE